MTSFVETVLTTIREVAEALIARIDALEQRELPRGLDGAMGPPGPAGPAGAPGPQGLPGRDGLNGRDGTPGAAGKDGLHGKDGANGRDGLDGLGFDDFDIRDDGERRITFVWSRGAVMREHTVVVPAQIYRGVWDADHVYERGDQVTMEGSQWTALTDPRGARPGDDGPQARAWQLSSKRGKDGKTGPSGPAGPAGRDGRDLTQLGPDGKKW